jgi:hypothetical protein
MEDRHGRKCKGNDMHTHARRLAAAGLPLALAFVLVAGDGGRAANVPRPVSGEMVLVRVEPDELTRYFQKVIQDELRAPAPNERALIKMRATALLIAAQAQSGRGARDVWQRAALRDNALKVQKALAEGKIDVARKRAAALFDINGQPADTRPVPLKDLMELDEVERLMKIRRVGGFGFGPPPGGAHPDGIELKLFTLVRKELTPAQLDAEAAHLARAAAVTGAMTNLLDAYTPDKKVGNKDPKEWKAHTVAMRAAAGELESAAKSKNAKTVKAAATRLVDSCSNCHITFRE